VKKLSVFDVKT